MDISIHATPEEIAGLVLALQDRQDADALADDFFVEFKKAYDRRLAQAEPPLTE